MRQRSIVLAFVLGFVAHAVAQDEPKPPSKVSAAQANLPALTAASVTENATQTAAELATRTRSSFQDARSLRCSPKGSIYLQMSG